MVYRPRFSTGSRTMSTSEWINLGSLVVSVLVALKGLFPQWFGARSKHKPRKSPGSRRRSPVQITDVVQTLSGASPEVRIGCWVAVLAALCWSLGNIAFRWTAQRVQHSTFEVAVVNYVVAGATLLAWGAVLRRFEPSHQPIQFPSLPRFVAVSLLKAINTYCWILSVATIPAAAASALENTHPLWAALPLVLLFGVRLPKTWIYGSVLVVMGAALVTKTAVYGFDALSAQGFAAALISGLAFAGFYVLWAGKGERPPFRSQRAIEMGSVMSMACILLFPIHVLVSALSPSATPALFGTLPRLDLLLQSVNGLIGIGLTYLLVGEALHRMRSVGTASSFLLGFAMSFAVPMTLALESLILGTPVEPFQWMGACIFFFGFFIVDAQVDETLRHRPLHVQAMSMS
jgi:drug/metabolite transporter (DMT)-like permease